ncbi:HEAT repeat domain-containing protein, partial [bacterium]|nr:HEAT repeat domain-containing protein [bacterium]
MDNSNPIDFEKIKTLSESHDEDDRKKAIILLTKTCSVKAFPILTEISENDPELNIKYYAKKAIFYLRKKLGVQDESVSIDSLPEKEGAGFKTRIQYSLYNVKPEVRKKALMVAIKFKDPYIIPSIITQLDKEEDATVRAMMLKTLGLLGNIANMEDVVKFLNDEDSRVRANAVEAIEYLGNKKLFPALIEKLQDSDNRVRANAIRAMQHFGGSLTLKFLKSMACSKNLPMRVSSAYALRFFPSPKVLPIVKGLLVDRNSDVITKTCESLKVLADQNFEPAKMILAKFSPSKDSDNQDIEKIIQEEENSQLLELTKNYLNSEFVDRRMTAVDKIRNNLPFGGFNVLLDRLKIEDDEKVISAIILCLGRYKNEDCITHLLPFLESANDRIRANSIEALSMLDSAEIYPLLAMYLEDPNNRARANAIVGLKSYKYFNCRIYLMKMLESNQELMILSALYSILEFADPELLDLLKHPYIYLNSTTQKKAIECLKMLADSNVSGAKELYDGVKATLAENDIPGQEIYDEMIDSTYETTKTLTEEELEKELVKNKADSVEKTLLLLDEIYALKNKYEGFASTEDKTSFIRKLSENINEACYNMLRYLSEIEKDESLREFIFTSLTNYSEITFRYVLKYDAAFQPES